MQNSDKKRFSQLGQTGSKRRLPGKGYSFFVRVMKMALPLVSVAIIGLLLSWPRVEETFEAVPLNAAAPQVPGKNELLKARFESSDEKKQPFSVTADRAVQSTRDPSVVLLEKPMADITLTNGVWLTAEAQRGTYRQKEERLLLQGKVKLFHDQGYEITTEKLLMDLKSQEAWSDRPVFGQGSAGSLQATGMQAYAQTNELIFTGPVKLILNRAVKGLE